MNIKSLINTLFCITMITTFFANEEPAGGASRKTDSEGHVLVSLWKDYSEAENADRPQLQQEILEKIMNQSKTQKLYWDYSCASTQWYSVTRSRNWKLQDSCRTRVMDDVAALDYPILTYTVRKYFNKEIDLEYFKTDIQQRADELRKHQNDAFYSKGLNNVPDFIIKCIPNDYEYLLWAVSFSGNKDDAYSQAAVAYRLLASEVGDRYPEAAYLEFLKLLEEHPYHEEYKPVPLGFYVTGDVDDAVLDTVPSRRETLEAFSAKYSGKAIALLSDQQILIDRFNDLNEAASEGADKSLSEDYRTLRADCQALQDRRDAYEKNDSKSGLQHIEALISVCAEDVRRMIGYLDSQDIEVMAKEGEISVLLQNIETFTLQLFLEGVEFLNVEVKNPTCSYFLVDTVKYKFPDCPDGEYRIVCTAGEKTASAKYVMHSISAAHRDINTGTGLYLADYLTGRPIPKADIEVLHDAELMKRVRDVEFDGFASIQWILDSVATEKRQRFDVRCTYVDDEGWKRDCDEMSFWVRKGEAAEPVHREPSQTGRIFLDRSAFNPGDSVQFKLLAYFEEEDGLRLANKGRRLRMELVDPDWNVIDSVALITNEFGTAAGKFDLPKVTKGGTYTLNAYFRNTRIASSAVTVDEFVLPAYDLEFDKVEAPYFAGDTISVKGKLTSYSGHSLSSVKVAYEVEYYSSGDRKVFGGSLTAGSDGRFDIRFVADAVGAYYHITVKATALDGETWEWSKTVETNPLSGMSIDLSGIAEGEVRVPDGSYYGAKILSSDELAATFRLSIPGVDVLPVIPISYSVRSGDEVVLSGMANSGTEEHISFEGLKSGLYRIEAEGKYVSESGHEIAFKADEAVFKSSDADTVIAPGVDYFYRKLDNGRIAVQLGTSEPERWFVAEVYSSDKELLHSEVFRLGTDSQSVRTLDFEYMDSYTDAVLLTLFSFKDGDSRNYSFFYERPAEAVEQFPLSFSSFTDKSLPHSECAFTLQTDPSVEAVAAVFDKSTETIRRNMWSAIRRYVNTSFYIGIGTKDGRRESGTASINHYFYEFDLFWGRSGGGVLYEVASPRLMTRSVCYSAGMADGLSDMDYDGVSEDAYSPELSADAASEPDVDTSDVQVRDGMDHSAVFLPFLRSDNEGKIEAKFTTSDRVSTFVVQVFAHDRQMRNAVLRREMTVSLPLEVSVAQPQFLYAGDVYRLRASVSNSDSTVYDGTMVVEVYDTEDYKETAPAAKFQKALLVGAENAASAEFEISVPHEVSVLGLKVTFIGSPASSGENVAETGDGGQISDAVFVSIPVKEPMQTVTEAHSKVVGGSVDVEAVKAELAAEFAGTDAEGAEYKEISLLDMITAAIPQEISAGGEDVLSRSRTFYALQMAKYLSARAGVGIPSTADASELIDKILSCRNSDGGFGWYEDFKSSPVLTAVVLERFAVLSRRGLIDGDLATKLEPILTAAIKYLDNRQFDNWPLWCGGLSLEQYLHVRTMYPAVAFEPAVPKTAEELAYESGKDGAEKKTKPEDGLTKFRKEVKEYLLPEKGSGLNGQILAKARRTMVSSVLSSDEGAALASVWGLKSSVRKLAKSYDADMLSLSEYAVEHPSGGLYYPNAVMPFRGLLESEAYAHALLCDLLEDYYLSGRGANVKIGAAAGVNSGNGVGTATLGSECHRIAEGIRLWLMIQKETQQWDDDPAFADAICMVLDGSDETLQTRIAVLTKQYTKPQTEIAAAGNGFTVERIFYRTNGDSEEGGVRNASSAGKVQRVELKEGDELNVGDKITAEYHVWNEENRSFVRLETPRYAALRPVEQLSGRVNGLFRFVAGLYGYYFGSIYREVKADRTILYFDVLAEENSTFTEDFYVTQAGVFTTPVVTVESAYAPHYRANDSSDPRLTVE